MPANGKGSDISPPNPAKLNDPQHWRDKAEEARTKADGMGDLHAREMMERVAQGYDRLAQLAEWNGKSNYQIIFAHNRDSGVDRYRLEGDIVIFERVIAVDEEIRTLATWTVTQFMGANVDSRAKQKLLDMWASEISPPSFGSAPAFSLRKRPVRAQNPRCGVADRPS